ncbi:MAG: hypothetical protein IKZ58_09075 [Selenomonadaceae bacterium]|nr:hypothetical protein [Selenomonadaceae bacterium]
MKCFVCGSEMKPFLEKDFGMENLGKCEYVRCEHCGIVVAKTLYEMPQKQWEAINYECHSLIFEHNVNYTDIDPKVYERFDIESNFLKELLNHGILKYDCRTIDYGAGDGKLADLTNSKIGKAWLKKFDAYMKPFGENYLSADEVKPNSFDFLITTSVFEHLLGNRRDVDKVIGLLNSDGVMALNLFVCEEMPDDPSWFYYIPVHCIFWTNKAMSIIYKKFGFKGCMYNVEACMWFMFRNADDFERLKSVADKLTGTLVFDENFVEYWKIKPKVSDFSVENSTVARILETLKSKK